MEIEKKPIRHRTASVARLSFAEWRFVLTFCFGLLKFLLKIIDVIFLEEKTFRKLNNVGPGAG